MEKMLKALTNGEILNKTQAKELLKAIVCGEYNDIQIAALLTVFLMRRITVEELRGFREAMLTLSKPVDLAGNDLLDICGTGGDNKNTFNISTLAAFVVAGTGINVAKHGNYAVSSLCGSSNVLEKMGIKLSSDEDFLKKCLDKASICLLHAPLFNNAMKSVAVVRKALKLKTFFNILGPLVNPINPKYALIGVFSLELLRIYNYLLCETDKTYALVYSIDGYDEIALTGQTKMITKKQEYLLDSSDFAVPAVAPDALSGGNSIAQATTLFINLLNGKGSQSQQDVVCANAGVAIALKKEIGLQEGFLLAKESLLSGAALTSFKTLQALSR